MNLNSRAFGYIVLFLGTALLLCIGGIVYLTAVEKPVDDILKITASSLVTGMLGLLIKTPAQEPEVGE
jgi:hypothetical protein